MANATDNSPITLEATDLWGQAPETPGAAFTKIGGKGHLYISGEAVYGLAETDDEDFVFCWFDGGTRRDSGVRTSHQFQNPHLDEQGRALVIGGAERNELYMVESSGNATAIGRATGVKLTAATWLADGFAVVENADQLHVYRWSPGSAPVGVGRYRGNGFEDIRAFPNDVLLSCEASNFAIYSLGSEVRELARFDVGWHNTFQCTDESGRSMWILPAPHISDGGGHFRFDGIEKALKMQDQLPAIERLGDALALEPCADLAAATETAAAAKFVARTPRTSTHWTYTNALLAMMKDQGKKRDQPIQSVLDCLVLPMEDELYAYIYFRAHYDVGVVAIYEAWLDAPPVLQGEQISLGTIANGDPIVARHRKIFEISHEEDHEREFYGFESWLSDVVHRTEDGTDLDPYLKDAAE